MKNCENCEYFQSCYQWCKKQLIEIKEDITKHWCHFWKQKDK